MAPYKSSSGWWPALGTRERGLQIDQILHLFDTAPERSQPAPMGLRLALRKSWKWFSQREKGRLPVKQTQLLIRTRILRLLPGAVISCRPSGSGGRLLIAARLVPVPGYKLSIGKFWNAFAAPSRRPGPVSGRARSACGAAAAVGGTLLLLLRDV